MWIPCISCPLLQRLRIPTINLLLSITISHFHISYFLRYFSYPLLTSPISYFISPVLYQHLIFLYFISSIHYQHPPPPPTRSPIISPILYQHSPFPTLNLLSICPSLCRHRQRSPQQPMPGDPQGPGVCRRAMAVDRPPRWPGSVPNTLPRRCRFKV